jgi:hypothetical protein
VSEKTVVEKKNARRDPVERALNPDAVLSSR